MQGNMSQEIFLSNKSVAAEFKTSGLIEDELSSNVENDCNVLNTAGPVSLLNPNNDTLLQESRENEKLVDHVSDSGKDMNSIVVVPPLCVEKNLTTNNCFNELDTNTIQQDRELNPQKSDDEPEPSSLFCDDGSNAILSDLEDEVQIKKKTKKFVMDSESEDEPTDAAGQSNKIEVDVVSQESLSLMPSLADLCDSESSEGEFYPDQVQSEMRQQNNIPQISKSRIKEKMPKVKRMTTKEALQQRQEIKSESQRMLRETPICLPYHKPKERSIREFLRNRPRLSVLKSAPDGPASVAIKMTIEELKLATVKMKEREKVLQKFYKSESESEDEISKEESKATDVVTDSAIAQSDAIRIKNSSSTEVTEENNVEVDTSIHINILCDKTIESNADNFVESHADDVEEPMETNELNTLIVQEVTNSNDFIENEQKESEDIHKVENSNLFIENDLKESEDVQNENLNVLVEHEEKNSNADIEKSAGLFCEDEKRKHKSIVSTDTHESQNKIIIHSIVTIPKKSIYELEESMDFDFNLDGIEEIPKNDSLPTILLGNDDNANVDCIDVPKPNKQDLLKQLGNYTPCLSGEPHCEIDLDDSIVESKDVIQFIERFKKQVEVKTLPKNKIKLDIINLSQGKVQNETVIVPTDDKEEPVDATDKPALRKQILRSDLQEQIAEQRVKLWKQKQQAFEEMTKTNEEESQVKSDYEDDILDDDKVEDEKEEQLFDDNDSDEEEEDDQEGVRTHRIRSAFIDGEAEVSDDDEDLESDGMEADDENAEDDVSCESKSMAQDDNHSVTNEFQSQSKKTLRRIITVFPDDSDEEVLLKEVPCDKVDSLFAEDDDDVNIPPYQPRPDITPRREMTQSKSDVTFHTPITQLSALEGRLNSGTKFLQESPVSPFPFPPSTPTVDTPTVKQKLFSDSCDLYQPETNTQELLGLCSGNFSLTFTEETEPLKRTQACTQDLLSICSGSFSDINTKADLDTVGSFNEGNNAEIENELILNSNSQSKYLEEDQLISQLLDEDEQEKLKEKFESPITNTCSTSNINDCNSEIKGGGRLVFDSSDDEHADNNVTIKASKHKKLYFSDDDSEDEQVESDEDIDLHDYVEDAEDLTSKEIDYDSEENEIEVSREKHKPSDFFEKEAELSESDWDSADEDEHGLDELEQEQGDIEVFDENKIKNDLERIHMRNILDQDNREIKILQEMLLEDGELHGVGRQRQFRWRNIDDNANDDKGPVDGDDVYLDEDESEEQWRKQKHEREMFLKNQEDKQNEDDIDSILSDSNSQVLKIGQEVLRRSMSNSSGQSDKDKTVCSSEVFKKSSILSNTRGSFLARSNNFLTRLADITKVNTTSVIKTSTKIVFQTSTALDEDHLESNKRKADDNTPIAIKKLRLSSNISPSLKGLERKKKLF